jgi:hypothetical protein
VHPATRTSLRVTPSVNGGGGVAGHVAFNRLDSDQGAGVSKRALRHQALDEGDRWRRWRQKELGAELIKVPVCDVGDRPGSPQGGPEVISRVLVVGFELRASGFC